MQELLKSAKAVAAPNTAKLEKLAEVATKQVAKGIRVVVFASSPALADKVFTLLTQGRRTPVFRHRLHDPEWRAFGTSSSAAILVCDSAAEEGLNLQGGSTCMLHADLPLSPNRIEQRIGRLDRFGIGNAVVSLSLTPRECPLHDAWTDCLSRGYGVFTQSIASLQYVIEDEMRAVSTALLTDGASALRDATDRLGGEQGALQKELKSIRAQDELDAIDVVAAAFGEDLTERIETLEEDSKRLRAPVEDWLLNRLNFVRVGVNDAADTTVRYHYARIGERRPTLMSQRDFALWFGTAVERGVRHPVFQPPLTWALTYSRESARSRKVGLGRIGNTVVDNLHRYLRWDDRGTCFVFWRVSSLRKASEVELFFRFDFVVEAGREHFAAVARENPTASEAALRRRADAAFPPIVRTVWISDDLQIPDARTQDELARPYTKGPDSNINNERWPLVQRRYDLTEWPHRCRAARAGAAEALIREVDLMNLTELLVARFQQQTSLVREQFESRAAALAQSSREAALARRECDVEISMRDALLAGIRSHGVRLDSAGAVFLSGAPVG